MTMKTWPCAHYSTAHGVCGEKTWTVYLVGPRCGAHTPARLAGRPEPAPDPTLTLEGLRKAARVERIRAQVEADHAANEIPGWTTTPPKVSPDGWVSQPGRKCTSVNLARVHRAEAAVGRQLERAAQILRVQTREGLR